MKICILGSGILGVMSAYALGKQGHEVTVIDRRGGAALECSYANGGQLSYSHAEPWANPYVFPKLFKWMWMNDAPLVLRPRADMAMIRWGLQFLANCAPARAKRHSEVLWRLGRYSKEQMAIAMADTNIAFDHVGKGILHVFANQASFDHAREQVEFQKELGCDESVLTFEQAVAMEPTLQHTAKKIYGGIHAPMDESGDLHAFTVKLAALCTDRFKTVFHHGVHVDALMAKNGAISHVKTSMGDITADAYVMSLGSYSPIYLNQVGLRVPIYPMKGYSITIPANEHSPTVSITDDNLKLVHSRLGNRVRIAGTAEFAGYNDSVRKARIDPIIRGALSLFPKADMSHIEEWACLRPSTPDGPPIIGKTPLSNLYMNTGHGTLGWTQAAGSAQLLADIVAGKETGIRMDGLSIDRFL